MNEISQQEALLRIAEAKEEYDECPECGEGFEGIDMTRGGDLVFIHGDKEMCSKETEVDHVS